MKDRIVVGVSGASGAVFGLSCLDRLREMDVESCLVLTRGAGLTIEQELDMSVEEFASHADIVFDNANVGASIASGTYRTRGMIVAPCSMKTLSGIVSGYSDNLLLRAADVTCKERRPLVLMARETPLSPIHIENMARASRVPNIVLMPPVMTFYNKPESIDDMVHHIVCKALDVFDLDCPGFKRWK